MKCYFSLREAARAMGKSLGEAFVLLEADASHDEIETALRKHLRSGERTAGRYVYRWPVAIYADHFVYSEDDENDVELLFSASYTYADGNVTVGTPVAVRRELKFIPISQDIAESATQTLHENFSGCVVNLRESAKGSIYDADGTFLLKIADAGEGSSGFYSEELLKEAGPAFPAGTQMFANHLTASQRMEQPEGDINFLAAVFTEDSKWMQDGPEGAALYARARPKEAYKDRIQDWAPDTGVSLDADGIVRMGEVNGRMMPIVEKLLKGNRVDFVTKAGRGGKIVPLCEAARPTPNPTPTIPAPPTPERNSNPQDINMTEAEKTQLLESARTEARAQGASDAVKTYRRAVVVAREALFPLSLPEATRTRIAEAQTNDLPLKDGALDEEALKARVTEAATGETRYLQEAAGWTGGGAVAGMGASASVETKAANLRESNPGVASAMSGLGL